MATVQDQAFGIVPFCQTDAGPKFLLIQHNKGHWGFPKGHKDEGETDLETAQREFLEEVGITSCEVIDTEWTIQEAYKFKSRQGHKVAKTVVYFLGYVPLVAGALAKVTVQPEEISAYRWCSYEEAMELITFDAARGVLEGCGDRVQAYVDSL